MSWRQAGASAHRSEDAAAAVIAVPGPAMLGIYPQLDRERREIVERISYGRAVTCSFGLAEAPAAPCTLLLIPPREHPDVLAILFEHRKAPGRAPAGKGLVSVYWQPHWSEAQWDLDDETVASNAVTAVAALMPGLLDSTEMSHVSRWDPGLAKGRFGLYRDLAAFARASDAGSRVRLAGDYLGFSTTGCSLASGEAAAASVAGRLVRA